MSVPTIIGIHGKFGAGKSTFARMLRERLGEDKWRIFAFGDRLKRTVEKMCDLPEGYLNTPEGKAEICPLTGETYGVMLQKMGQGVRDIFNPYVWIRALLMSEQAQAGPVNRIVDDVRYKTEVDAIKKRGGILIKIIRAGGVTKTEVAGRSAKHFSEIDLDGCDHMFDRIFTFPDNGIEEMGRAADELSASIRKM
jgi:ABC-type dipeptide/oligopeptide/nickel transport system ATPase subunit